MRRPLQLLRSTAYFLGETHFNEGEVEQALGYFSRVLEVKPDHYEGMVYSGVIYYERGDHGRAEEHLKRAVASYPDSFLPLFSLGAVYTGQGNLAKSVLFLERAVQFDAVPQAFYLLGSCYYEMGTLISKSKSPPQPAPSPECLTKKKASAV